MSAAEQKLVRLGILELELEFEIGGAEYLKHLKTVEKKEQLIFDDEPDTIKKEGNK